MSSSDSDKDVTVTIEPFGVICDILTKIIAIVSIGHYVYFFNSLIKGNRKYTINKPLKMQILFYGLILSINYLIFRYESAKSQTICLIETYLIYVGYTGFILSIFSFIVQSGTMLRNPARHKKTKLCFSIVSIILVALCSFGLFTLYLYSQNFKCTFKWSACSPGASSDAEMFQFLYGSIVSMLYGIFFIYMGCENCRRISILVDLFNDIRGIILYKEVTTYSTSFVVGIIFSIACWILMVAHGPLTVIDILHIFKCIIPVYISYQLIKSKIILDGNLLREAQKNANVNENQNKSIDINDRQATLNENLV